MQAEVPEQLLHRRWSCFRTPQAGTSQPVRHSDQNKSQYKEERRRERAVKGGERTDSEMRWEGKQKQVGALMRVQVVRAHVTRCGDKRAKASQTNCDEVPGW